MTAQDDAVQAATEALRAEGWMCDPWGHDDGPVKDGECRDCDLMLRDGARMALAAAAPILLAEAERRIRARATWRMADPSAWLGTANWEALQEAADVVQACAARIAETAPEETP